MQAKLDHIVSWDELSANLNATAKLWLSILLAHCWLSTVMELLGYFLSVIAVIGCTTVVLETWLAVALTDDQHSQSTRRALWYRGKCHRDAPRVINCIVSDEWSLKTAMLQPLSRRMGRWIFCACRTNNDIAKACKLHQNVRADLLSPRNCHSIGNFWPGLKLKRSYCITST